MCVCVCVCVCVRALGGRGAGGEAERGWYGSMSFVSSGRHAFECTKCCLSPHLAAVGLPRTQKLVPASARNSEPWLVPFFKSTG